MMIPSKIILLALLCLHLLLVSVRSDTSDLGTLRSLNASVTASSEYSWRFALSQAVDGSNRYDGDNCTCCAATETENDPWMRVDLGGLYRVGTVEVFARTEKEQNLTGMKMFIHIEPDNWESSHTLSMTIPQTSTRTYTFAIHNPVTGQYVTLQLKGEDILVVCEIKIYSQDCPPGMYGPNCTDTCGKCQDDDTCDHVTGQCTRCAAGYRGDACKTECSNSTFGQGCSISCHCFNNQSCDNVIGVCPGGKCNPGWHGNTCSDECDPGHFGVNCEHSCRHCFDNKNCDKRTGVCRSCSIGYIGDMCTEECQQRTFGVNCSLTCGSCRDPCDVFTGICLTSGCLPGYQGNFCTESCNNGFYGNNCQSECGHCANNVTCNNTNGHCKEGCMESYEGDRCDVDSQALESDPSSSSSPAAMVAAVGTSVVVVSVVIVLVVIVWRRRRGNLSRQEKSVEFSTFQSTRLREETTTTSTSDAEDGDTDTHVYAQVVKDKNKAKRQPSLILEEDDLADNSTDVLPDHEYYSFEPRRIQVCNLWDYIQNDRANSNETLHREFELIKKCPTHPVDVALSDENIRKNRYRELFAYDHTRVPLRTRTDYSDYINANFIEGHAKKNKFIAAQGPIKVMVNDFWLMIYQQKCRIVIMLTNLMEAGAKKCIRYWPQKGEAKFGEVRVKLVRTEEHEDYVIRHFDIKQADGPRQSVRQYHFKAWPDKDVPDNVWCLVNFWRVVDSRASTLTTPIVVHCSAGIGRTGTFIALDNMFYQAKDTGAVSPFEVVRKLREQRIKMVQTQPQYIYLHDAIAEIFLMGTEAVMSSLFDQMYAFMNEPDKHSGSRYGIQMKLIEDSMADIPIQIQEDMEYSNVSPVVNDAGIIQVQVDEYLMSSTTEASYIPMVTGPRACIITQSPGTKDIKMFWNLIHQLRVKTVVMATRLDHPEYQTCLCLGVPGEMKNGNLTIQKAPDQPNSSQKTFTVNSTDMQNEAPSELTVKQFVIPTCSEGSSVPRDARAVAAELNAIINWNSQQKPKGVILVHCGDGGTTSGMIAVALNEILRMKHKNGVINILESVKTMKKANRSIITTKEQLKFCYDAVWAYLHLDDVYQNV